MTTELDRLPPDQRAVLSLVLDRGKSYAEVAQMLAIPERAVRDRAIAALDTLAGRSTSPDALAGGPAPGPAREPTEPGGVPAGSGLAVRAGSRPRDAGGPRDAHANRTTPSSRTAGALLLGAIVAVVVVAVILVSSSGGGGKSSTATSTAAPSSKSTRGSTSTSNAGKVAFDKKIVLTPLEPTLPGKGEAYVLSQGNRRAFYVAAQGLPPSSGFFYAVWLYNSPSSSAPLGRAPAVGSDGRLQGGGPLPTNAGLYHQVIVTRETSSHPAQPGAIVLRGTFALH